MSAFDLLVDCVKDATKERDELADALEQVQKRVAALVSELNEIAIQELSTEGETPGEGDYEFGYDECVKHARKALLIAGDTVPDDISQEIDDEINRISAMSDAEIRTELTRCGLDPDEEAMKVADVIQSAIRRCEVVENSNPLMDVILEDLKENDVDPDEVFGSVEDTGNG